MAREKIESLVIIGKTWFQKTYGNTYHTATVFVNGTKLKSNITYGGEKQYLVTAANLLRKTGYDIPENEYDAFRFIVLTADWDDVIVARKKDL